MTEGLGGAAAVVYVYGVVPSKAAAVPGGSSGVGDAPQPVRSVAAGDLAALVSDVPAGWTAAHRRDVEVHERVLSEALARGTVLPMRFGVVMDSDDQVREELLVRHAERLTAALERLRDRVQMTLKAFYEEDALLRSVLRANPQLKRRSDALEGRPAERTHGERVALGRDVAQAVEAQRAADARMLVEAVAPVVVEVRSEPPTNERMALNAQLLVDRERREVLDDAVRRLSDQHSGRFAFRYVGPVPPYSFADISLDEAAV
jgi:hypothetical protein